MSTSKVRSNAIGFFFDAPIVALLLMAIIGYLWPGLSFRYAGWPFVVSLFVVGMPHGAVDFFLNARLRSASHVRNQIQSFAWYTVTLIVGLITLIVFPKASVVLFAVTSAQHFGVADARALDQRFQTIVPDMIRRCSSLARGLIILALPFLFYPVESLQVVNSVLQTVSALPIVPAVTAVTFVATACLLVAGAALLASTTYRVATGDGRAALLEWLETSVIVAAFATLHPLFAMGLYLVAWHAWRHLYAIGPFLGVEPRSARFADLLRSVWQVHVAALPLMVPTLILYGLVASWRLPAWSSMQLAALTIATFIVVTLPHHLLIERLFATSRDRDKQRNSQEVRLVRANGSLVGRQVSAGRPGHNE